MIPAARPIIGDEERAAVDAVLASGMIAQGPPPSSADARAWP
jgi:dTDP-4-amino-4,6-dideoxygalactose transaminase